VPGGGSTLSELRSLMLRFLGLWRSFLPMLSLFFCLSFINTILDSLKDTLVITAPGGGAHVIPWLTVYAVLPASLVFLYVYSVASHRMSRAALFNAIVAGFMGFFALFAAVLYPNAAALHPHDLADALQTVRCTLS
jgi:AAA family ATP:ADP antiporter